MSVGHVHKVYSIMSICKNDVYSTQLLIMDFEETVTVSVCSETSACMHSEGYCS